ncbi:MAG: hypothetical protein M3P96_01760 [Actinomycetota bacterium]|nr:hypothetical protein [Actinomycetota bacterium]
MAAPEPEPEAAVAAAAAKGAAGEQAHEQPTYDAVPGYDDPRPPDLDRP